MDKIVRTICIGIAAAAISIGLMVGFCGSALNAHAQEACAGGSLHELVGDTLKVDDTIKVTTYKGEDAAKIAAVAKKQSGHDFDADTVTVMVNDEDGIIILSKGDCPVLGAHGPTQFIKAIISGAVGSET